MLGVYYEDYFFNQTCANQGGVYLDSHNGHSHDSLGYHYHITVDNNNKPVFPYLVGPKFYGCTNMGCMRSRREMSEQEKLTAKANCTQCAMAYISSGACTNITNPRNSTESVYLSPLPDCPMPQFCLPDIAAGCTMDYLSPRSTNCTACANRVESLGFCKSIPKMNDTLVYALKNYPECKRIDLCMNNIVVLMGKCFAGNFSKPDSYYNKFTNEASQSQHLEIKMKVPMDFIQSTKINTLRSVVRRNLVAMFSKDALVIATPGSDSPISTSHSDSDPDSGSANRRLRNLPVHIPSSGNMSGSPYTPLSATGGPANCTACALQFNASGGCVLMKSGQNPSSKIPQGCQSCAAAAAAICGIGTGNKDVMTPCQTCARAFVAHNGCAFAMSNDINSINALVIPECEATGENICVSDIADECGLPWYSGMTAL